jgi:hypothetical protein
MEIMRMLASACFISHQFFSFGKITLLDRSHLLVLPLIDVFKTLLFWLACVQILS